MALNGSVLTFSLPSAVTANVAVVDVTITPLFIPFVRLEKSNELKRKAKEADGSEAIFEYTAGNTPFQIFDGCGDETARPLVPDDANLTDIFKRFDTKRFEIKGVDTPAAEVEKIYAVAKTHQALLAQFEAYQNYLKSDITIGALGSLAALNFSYLTSTTVSVAGNALGAHGPASNIIITKFSETATIEVKTNSAGTTYNLYKTFSLELEVRAITSLENTTWVGV